MLLIIIPWPTGDYRHSSSYSLYNINPMKHTPLLLLTLSLVCGTQWTQTQLDTLRCESDNNDKRFGRGEAMTICLQLVPLDKKLSFSVLVDDYTALKMSGST